jgi:hypothetical protein
MEYRSQRSIPELFDTRIRYTGLVSASEVSGSIIGGFTPLFATWLILSSGGRSSPVFTT